MVHRYFLQSKFTNELPVAPGNCLAASELEKEVCSYKELRPIYNREKFIEILKTVDKEMQRVLIASFIMEGDYYVCTGVRCISYSDALMLGLRWWR